MKILCLQHTKISLGQWVGVGTPLAGVGESWVVADGYPCLTLASYPVQDSAS